MCVFQAIFIFHLRSFDSINGQMKNFSFIYSFIGNSLYYRTPQLQSYWPSFPMRIVSLVSLVWRTDLSWFTPSPPPSPSESESPSCSLLFGVGRGPSTSVSVTTLSRFCCWLLPFSVANPGGTISTLGTPFALSKL